MTRKGPRRPRVKVFVRQACTLDQVAEKLAQTNLSADNCPSGKGPWPKFEDMGLNPKILQGILAYGYEKPATIQKSAIVPIIRGSDVVMQAQSGMGKTAALCIGILQRLDLSDRHNIQALILAPTRELALQITGVFRKLGQYLGIKCLSCTGGTPTKIDKEKLSGGGISIVVGTLGRLLSLAKKDKSGTEFLLIDMIKVFAVDEADMMLTDRSTQRDFSELLSTYVPGNAQIILMSATNPPLALDRINEFLATPEFFLVNNAELTLEGIRQFHINVDDDQRKIETLFDLRDVMASEHTLVFCNTRNRVHWLQEQLAQKGDTVFSSSHGELDQGHRNRSLQEFRSGKTRLIIASDLLGRGIDIQQVSLVINYDLPKAVEEYIHRVGRGGRYGRHGTAISFVTKDEIEHLKKISQFYNTDIPPMPSNIFK